VKEGESRKDRNGKKYTGKGNHDKYKDGKGGGGYLTTRINAISIAKSGLVLKSKGHQQVREVTRRSPMLTREIVHPVLGMTKGHFTPLFSPNCSVVALVMPKAIDSKSSNTM
jgi:hypothetical protein